MRTKGPIAQHLLLSFAYIVFLYGLQPASLRDVIPAWRWSSLCILLFFPCLWLIGDMVSYWCLLNDHVTLWQLRHMPVDPETLETFKRYLLCEGQGVVWEKGFASKCLLAASALTAIAFIYFIFFVP